MSVNGGEIVFGRDLPNVGQMGILVDGCYIAGENNGFWSLGSTNDWGTRRGFYWDGSYLNFTTNSAVALFSDARAPIFYDSDDTAYYLNQASGSNLKYLQVSGAWGSSPFGSGHETFTIRSTYASFCQRQTNGNLGYWLHHIPTDGSYMLYGGRGATDASNWDWSMRAYPNQDGSYVEFRTSARAPIFYDLNDTTYYVDPAASTSINVNGYIISSGTGGNKGAILGNLQVGYAGTYNTVQTPTNADTIWLQYSHSGNVGLAYGGGYTTAYNSIRSPIFYDSNDTTYYIDPASFSLTSSIGIGGLTSSNNVQMYDSYVDASSSYLQSPPLIIRKDSSATGAIDQAPVGLFIYNLNGTNNTWTKLSLGSREAAGAGNTVSIGGLAAQKTAGTANSWATGNLHFWTKAGGTQITNMVAYSAGYVQSDYSFRAPIFYDSNNTAFYVDGAGTSRLAEINIDQGYTYGWWRNWSSGNGIYNQSTGQHFYSDDVSYWNVASSSSSQGIRLRTGGHGGTVRGYFYADTNNDVGILNNAGNWRLRVVGGDYGLADGSSMRAQIFYDSNNTGYYIDAASTSVLSSLTIAADANVELYKSQTVDMSNTTTYSTSNYYPVTIPVLTEGCIIQIQNNLNSNVPSWSTHGAGFTLNLKWRTNASGWGTTDVRRYVEQYHERFANQTICGGITQMTNSSIEVVWLRGGGQYLFKFSRNLTATAQSSTFTSNSQSVSPTSSAQNAIWDSVSGYEKKYNNTTLSTDSMYTPVLYDYNNTAYYIDAASTSNLVGLTVANTITGSISGNAVTAGGLAVHTGTNNEANKIVRTDGNGYLNAGWINTPSGDMADTATINRIYCSDDNYIRYKGVADFQQQIGLTYKYSTPRSANTTDTNYWVGTMGWGTTDLNTIFDYGCGFFDSWSNPGNQPSGSSHWNGIQSIHYTNGSSRYGWQMVVGAGSPAYTYIRGTWGTSFGSWYLMWNSANDGAGSGLDADLLDGYNSATANTANTIVLRDGSGNFSAGTITATLNGSSTSCTGNSATVTINYNNDSNSTYQMLWGAGNNVYGTAGVYLNPSTDYVYATSFNASDWFRSSGATGWYNSTYGGGIYMNDTTWVRVYNNKYFYCDTIIQAGSDMRSPIYYDANDTNYYLDPASTSNLLLVKTRNTFGQRIAVTASSPITIDTQYSLTQLTLTGSISSMSFSNIQADGIVHMWTIVTVGNATAYTITWPAAVKWPGGTAPTVTTTNTKRDIYQFVTYDGGTNIYAIIVGQNL
jgi:hypothetical protein